MKQIFKADNVPVDWDQVDVTGFGDKKDAELLFQQSVDSLKRNKVGLKGETFPVLHSFPMHRVVFP